MNKLSVIQQELKAPKNQYNKFGNYKYRSCEDILEAVKPLLAKENCTLIINDDIVMIGNRFYVKSTVEFNDGENKTSVSAYAREDETKKGMDGSQITGAASSYARKYALNGLFLIDDNKDADTNENVKQNTKTFMEENHIKTIEAYCKEFNTSIDKICSRYGINNIKSMTYEQFTDCCNGFEKAKKQ